MALFNIVDGKLSPMNPGPYSVDDMFACYGCTGEPNAEDGSLGTDSKYVLVTGAREPVKCVPLDKIVMARFSEWDVRAVAHLFWAINDGTPMLVACEKGRLEAWYEVRETAWTRLPYRRELVRSFNRADEAHACVEQDGLILVEHVDLGDGWRGIEVRGHSDPWEQGEIVLATDERVVHRLKIPQGTVVYSRELREIPFLASHQTERANQALGPQLKDAGLVRVVITADGITLVVRVARGRKGILIAVRTFSHEEARKNLALKLS